MSDQQNPQGKSSPLPGLGPKPGPSSLPGLGGGGPGAAPLPGLGAKSPLGAAPLPGARPSAAPLPGRPSAPPGAFPGLGARGPAGAPVPRPSAPPPAYIPESIAPPAYDATVDSKTAAASTPQKVVIAFLAVAVLFIGYNVGKAWSNRVQLNISLRDSMVVQYEVDKAMRLFDELDAVINGAIHKATKYEYEPKHIEYLATNIKEAPIKAQLFTDRSYKNFGRKAAPALSNYGMKWAALTYAIKQHVEKTRANEIELKGMSDKLLQILKSQYGVTFMRKGNDLRADIVYIGKPEEKKGKVLIPVGKKPAPTEDPREAWSPTEEGDEGKLTESPETYVVILSPEAARGALSGRTKDVFNEYVARLDDLRGKMKMMRDEQTSLTRMLAELASQEPAAIAPPDSEAEFRTYVAQDGKAAGPAPAPGK